MSLLSRIAVAISIIREVQICPFGERVLESSAPTISLWNDVLAHVEKRLNANVFDTWFKRISFDSFDAQQGVISLSAADITRDWVTRYYSSMIDEILDDLGLGGC